MAIKTFRLAAGVDGNFAALAEADQAAASRTDGWTVGKLAAVNSAELAVTVKQATTAFSLNGTTAKPSGLLPNSPANAFKTPAVLTGTFAATAWTFTFAARATVASAQAGRVRLRVFKSQVATGGSAVELTAATQIGTTSVALTTTADGTTVVTWSPGAITLNNDYLFFVVAWEITTPSGSNTGDVVLRTGQSAAGTRIVTPDFVLGPLQVQTVPANAAFSAQAGSEFEIPYTAPLVALNAGTNAVCIVAQPSAASVAFSALASVPLPVVVTTPASSLNFSASASAVLSTAANGSVNFSAIATLPSGLSVPAALTTFSASPMKLSELLSSPGATATLSGASSAAESLTTPPTGLLFSAVGSLVSAVTASGTFTASTPALKLGWSAISSPGTSTFSAIASSSYTTLAMSVVSPSARVNFSASAIVPMNFQAVGNAGFSAFASGVVIATTATGRATFSGLASFGVEISAVGTASFTSPTYVISYLLWLPSALVTFEALNLRGFGIYGIPEEVMFLSVGASMPVITSASGEAAEITSAGRIKPVVTTASVDSAEIVGANNHVAPRLTKVD